MDVTDEFGVALRIKPWIAYKCDIRRWFTWESTHWYPNSNEVPNDEPKNVFVDPVTFYAGYDGSRGNGDGTMFYPGEDYDFPDQNREYPGPMSSIRMKMYRRGIQDYEYMWLADRAGQGQQVQAILGDLLPHVMWDSVTVPDWSNSNAVYESARRQFAELATRPTGLPTLLEVHPNERGPGPAAVARSHGLDYWAWPSLGSSAAYTWKVYDFGGSGNLWVQVCAQTFSAYQNSQNGSLAKEDWLKLIIDGLVPADVWGIQSGPPGGLQWQGSSETGKRLTLEFLAIGLTPGPHQLKLLAQMSPIIYWVKVYDLEASYAGQG
jgi:hypothetical protein